MSDLAVNDGSYQQLLDRIREWHHCGRVAGLYRYNPATRPR